MDIVVTREFRKNFKHLSGKYASLRDDLRLLQSQLMENPFIDLRFQPLACTSLRWVLYHHKKLLW